MYVLLVLFLVIFGTVFIPVAFNKAWKQLSKLNKVKPIKEKYNKIDKLDKSKLEKDDTMILEDIS